MIAIVRAPAYATVQDLGRTGSRDAGVPSAGAMDAVSLSALNIIVGNDRSSAGIEMALTGGVFSFEEATTVALGGAEFTGALGGRMLESYRAYRARAGDVLTVETISGGRFLYVAVAGGLDVPQIIGSRSTYVPGGFGGASGRRIKSGDSLPVGSARKSRRHQVTDSLPLTLRPPFSASDIRFVPRSDEAGRAVAGTYTISSSSDRTGYRLDGAPRTGGGSVVSEPVCAGVIQLPAGGEPIILMADAPTIGGYRVMGGVISADLGVLAQKLPGAEVTLVATSIEKARREAEKVAEVETLIEEWCLG